MGLYVIDYATNQPTHGIFVGWLNRLNDNYVSGFYDDAIKNLLALAELEKHRTYIQNLYDAKGVKLLAFMSVLSSNEADKLLMIHDMDGEPFAYAQGNLENIFSFDDDGNLSGITFDEGLFLKNPDGSPGGTLYLTEQTTYGNAFPQLDVTVGNTELRGVITVNYDPQSTGGYVIENSPLAQGTYYRVTNITDKQIIAEIPLLPKFSKEVTIPAGGSIEVISTPTSDYFFRQGMYLDALRVKLIS